LDPAVQVAATTRGAAVKALPALEGKTLTEIRAILQKAGFAKDPASTAAQEFWTFAGNATTKPDGSVVRIALQGTTVRPAPHLKKEISFNLGFGFADIACKVTDAGVPVPQGEKEAREILKYWFRGIAGEAPDATADGALDIMVRIWGDATHIPFK